jgi:hypothetical protein
MRVDLKIQCVGADTRDEMGGSGEAYHGGVVGA